MCPPALATGIAGIGRGGRLASEHRVRACGRRHHGWGGLLLLPPPAGLEPARSPRDGKVVVGTSAHRTAGAHAALIRSSPRIWPSGLSPQCCPAELYPLLVNLLKSDFVVLD